MDSERLDELFDRYLDRDLSAAEESELAGLLARPDCQAYWRQLASLEGKIQEELLVPAAGESRRLLKKNTGRAPARRIPPYGLFAMAAAGVLVAAIWILSSGPDVEPAGIRKKADVAAEADAKRRERETRLREIEEKRKALEAAPAPSPELKEKRAKDRERLRAEQEQTERELKEAIELAKKTVPPPLPEQKPIAPPEPPKDPREIPRTEAMVATVERVDGNASLVGKDGNVPVQKGQGILAGQGVETGAKGFLAIKYVDGTLLEIGEEAVLRELKVEGGKRLHVEKGVVRATVAKQPKDQPMILSTSQGQARIVGTTLRLIVDPDPKKGTKLEVEEGRVELRNLAGKTLLVESGHYAVAAAGLDLAANRLPIDEIFLTLRNVVVTGADWRMVNDDMALSKQALEATRAPFADTAGLGKYVTYLKTTGSRAVFKFSAEGNKEYKVWVRGQWGPWGPVKNGSVTLVAPEGRFVNPCLLLGSTLDNAFLFDHFIKQKGYWWVGGNEHDGQYNRAATVRFARSGEVTLALYVSEPIRIDAIWLSATQKSRPEPSQELPSRAGK